jgi:hypothetical protein
MNILNAQEIDALVARSQLVSKYAETIDRDSAHEMLSRQIEMMQPVPKKTKRGGRKKQSLKSGMNNTPHDVPNYNDYENYRQGSQIGPPAVRQEPTINRKRSKRNRKDLSSPNISTLGQILNSSTSREVGRTAANALTRGILGTLGLNTTSETRSTNRKTKKRQNTMTTWF